MAHARAGMRRLASIGLLAALVAAQGIALGAKAPRNDLPNGGFERVSGGKVYGWSTPEYWGGAIAPEAAAGMAHGGKRCARLTTTFARNKHWGRTLTSARRMEFFVGSRHRYSMWVKGKGEFLLGYIQYVPAAMRKPPYKYYMQETATTLTDTWQQVVYEFTMDDPRTTRIAPVAEVRGEGAVAWLDDAVLASAADHDAAIRVEPHHPMLPPGGYVDIRITALKKGKPLASGEITVIAPAKEGGPTTSTLAIGKTGAATYRFTATAGTEEGIHTLTFSHAATGVGQPIVIDVVDKTTCDAFEQAAKRTKLDASPAHYLFIGDSLTDMARGRNYVDKVGFWLWKAHGARATVRNVGVGGDFISRVWQRLNNDPKSYRLSMYDDLYEPMPTHVLIFLGHNDSKLSSRSGYRDACVAPDLFEREYRLAIRKVQKDTKARITVLSATSSVYEITKANSDKRAAAGNAHNLFGKPEALEQFNAIARKVAAECGAGYLDVYEPTRTHPDKPSLFTPDGVHVNNNGNRLLALEILKYLGR